ncbi:MAG TPA: OmpH family outer membrane protein [Thermoanaerobaculia bacterium]|jgi:outer membrane protein|nr:OmpH family outer membrane protein [Thermoanaerobaculia bacterium]
MKRAISTVLAASLAAVAAAQTAPSSAPASASVRIAVIDVERLVRDSALGKEAFSRVKKLSDDKKSENDRLQKELRDIEQKLSTQGQSLSDDKREQLQKQYNEKSIDYKSFTEKASRDLDQAQKKELADLERRVFPIITQLGKERGYTLIFNKFQSGLVFADETADITEDVLKRFNTTVAVPPAAAAKAPAGAPPAAPAPAPTKKPS